jgi:2-dehydro-3-deoxy-D-arabinonate dehydratase
MTRALFRLELNDGSIRLARGTTEDGPHSLLPAGQSIERLLADGARALAAAVLDSPVAEDAERVPMAYRLLAPVDSQEIWAAGVTYERSRDARMEESDEPSVYDHVYDAVRPELFFKAAAWRVRTTGEPIGIRGDSGWDVPEPELGLVVSADLAVAGYVIANDMSSRTIEGENPLYLPQAKIYDGSCAIGPAMVPASEVEPPFAIGLRVEREGATILDETTSTIRIRRSFDELTEHLGRALTLPAGAVLLTGTGVVPEPGFTLAEGDIVRIDGGPLGQLVNSVVLVGRAAPVQPGGNPADGNPAAGNSTG